MGCCGDDEKDKVTPTFKPYSERSCTDVLLLLLYLGAWAGFIAILVDAIKLGGNPYKFIHGVDYRNRVCGTDAGVTDLPYAAWPYSPIKSGDLSCSSCSSLFICLSSCNDTATSTRMTDNYVSQQFVYFCVPSTSIDGSVSISFQFSGDFESTANQASRAIAALITTWPLILASAFVALFFSFVFLWFARKLAGVMVFFAIVLLLIGGVLASVALLKAAADAQNSALTQRATAMKGLGWTVAAVTLVFLLVCIFLRKQIELAVEVVKESSHAISDMKMLPFFPVYPFILAGGYFVFWVAVALFIFSIATTSPTPIPAAALACSSGTASCELALWAANNASGGNYTKNNFDQGRQGTFAYSFFHLLWTMQFLVYFCFLVIAGAVAQWYFSLPSPSNPNEKQRGDGPDQLANSPVAQSAARTIRFHLGTIAFGSLIIAIIQFLRAVVNYLEKKTHASQGGMLSRLQKILFCLIKCCLRCVECCCDRISKNAFVWTAVYGSNFISAACASFSLVWSNLARTAALTAVSTYVLFIGKLMVALMSAGLCGLIASRVYSSQISSPVMPMVVMFLLSYVIASMFMAIFETTVDTLFLCFLIDEHAHGAAGLKYAGPSLRKIVDDHSSASAEKATEYKRLRESRQAAMNDGAAVLQESNAPAASAPGMATAGATYN